MMKLFAILALAIMVKAAPAADKVEMIPGMAKFDTYGLYSGYIPIVNTTKNIHYLFVESQGNKTTDPLLLWFNGGPGCSSMLGFASEHGPYLMGDGSDEFVQNDFSWNQNANVLYIEQPAGVGYSYCNNDTNPEDCTFDDDSSAKDNLAVVLSWFDAFPEYQKNDFYISGESYAGIYVPYLANEIYQHNETNADFKPNLKGFMVGNGVTNWRYDTDPAYIEMGYWHSLYSQDTRDLMVASACNYSMMAFPDHSVSQDCEILYYRFTLVTKDVNIYDVFGYCWPQDTSINLSHPDNMNIVVDGGMIESQKKSYTAADYTPWIPHLKKMKELGTTPPCIFGDGLVKFFNDPAVKTALHISDKVEQWDMCSDLIGDQYTSGEKGSQWLYENLMGYYRVLVYSGDTDGAVPTTGTLAWIEDMIAHTGQNVTDPWRPYFWLEQGQKSLAGYTQAYDGNFTFASIHGAGHMAPQFKPAETYYLVSQWLAGEDI